MDRPCVVSSCTSKRIFQNPPSQFGSQFEIYVSYYDRTACSVLQPVGFIVLPSWRVFSGVAFPADRRTRLFG